MTGKLFVQYNLPDDMKELCKQITGLELTENVEESEYSIIMREPRYGSRTRVFQTLSSGVNHLNRDEFPASSTVLNNAGGFDEPVTETVFALILTHIKDVSKQNEDMHNIKFNRGNIGVLYGKTMGILGFGGIGKMVARVAGAFGMNVVAYTPHPKDTENVEFLKSPEELFQRSSALVISCPLTEETRNLVDSSLLGKFKGSMIVNIARAEVVNRDDMLDFLEKNRDIYYLSDVWWNEPDISAPIPDNVVVTPHIGGLGLDFRPVFIERACRNLRNYIEGKPCHIAFRT